MIPSWARVGAKVVCVNDDPLSFYGPGYRLSPLLVKAGTTYAIREVTTSSVDGGVTLKFCGIKDRSDMDEGYAIDRFRPLITEADDIALFKSLLNPTLVDKLDLLAERLDHIYNE